MRLPILGSSPRTRGGRAALWTGAALFALVFFVPVAVFYASSLSNASTEELTRGLTEVFTAPATYRTVVFTTGQAALSAFLCIVLGLPGAYLISHFNFPLKRLVTSLTLIPFVLPSIIVIICMISFYGKSGFINRILGTNANLIYNFSGILLAHVFYNLSLAVRIIGEGWQNIDMRYREVAQSVGEKGMRTFTRITLPLLIPSILTAFVIIFIYCFLSFGVVLVFGGIRFATLEVRIYQEMHTKLNLINATFYSLIQLGFSVLFIVVSNRLILGRRAPASRGGKFSMRRLSTEPVWKRTLLAAYGVLALAFLFGPLVTMILRAVRGDGWRFGSDAVGTIESIIRSSFANLITSSLGLCLASGTVTFFLALGAALHLTGSKSTWFDSFFQSPMGMSLVSLCIALRLLVGEYVPAMLLVITAQVFLTFPFVFRILRTTCEHLNRSYVEAAQSLGARTPRVLLSVTVPILRKGLLNAYAYSLAIPLADFTAVLTVGGGRIVTFPVAIFRLIGFRNFDVALALGVVYICFSLILFVLIDVTSGEDQ